MERQVVVDMQSQSDEMLRRLAGLNKVKEKDIKFVKAAIACQLLQCLTAMGMVVMGGLTLYCKSLLLQTTKLRLLRTSKAVPALNPLPTILRSRHTQKK